MKHFHMAQQKYQLQNTIIKTLMARPSNQKQEKLQKPTAAEYLSSSLVHINGSNAPYESRP